VSTQTVWKLHLPTFANSVPLPDGATPLSVQWQGDALCLWALVDPTQPRVRNQSVMVVFTGGAVMAHPAPDLTRARFLGTVQQDGLVYHAFACGLDIQHDSNRDIYEKLVAAARSEMERDL
jgi:hypothetical protein